MNCLIFDPAHGKNVVGKQSPDGKFKEYIWSRQMIRRIIKSFGTMALPFAIESPFLGTIDEPGLRRRWARYNFIDKMYDNTLVLSLHTDAFKGQWWDGTGFSFFTSRENNQSDKLAEILATAIHQDMPEERIRKRTPYDVSKDKNFTVIAGYPNKQKPATYHAILIENGFMDSTEDIIKLTDDKWNKRLADAYVIGILEMFYTLGDKSILPQLNIKS